MKALAIFAADPDRCPHSSMKPSKCSIRYARRVEPCLNRAIAPIAWAAARSRQREGQIEWRKNCRSDSLGDLQKCIAGSRPNLYRRSSARWTTRPAPVDATCYTATRPTTKRPPPFARPIRLEKIEAHTRLHDGPGAALPRLARRSSCSRDVPLCREPSC